MRPPHLLSPPFLSRLLPCLQDKFDPLSRRLSFFFSKDLPREHTSLSCALAKSFDRTTRGTDLRRALRNAEKEADHSLGRNQNPPPPGERKLCREKEDLRGSPEEKLREFLSQSRVSPLSPPPPRATSPPAKRTNDGIPPPQQISPSFRSSKRCICSLPSLRRVRTPRERMSKKSTPPSSPGEGPPSE